VAKNGILMLDLVVHLKGQGHSPEEALVRMAYPFALCPSSRLRAVQTVNMTGH
jgi:hypothetical protein